MNNHIFKLSCSLFLIIVIKIYAQTSEVVSYDPSFNEIVNNKNPQISVTFNLSMDSSSFNNISFSVFGERTGYHSGIINYSDEIKTVTFNSSKEFSAGERVHVTLSKHIKSAQGDSLKSFNWGFRISSKNVGLNFSNPVSYVGGGWGMQCIDMNNDGSPDIVTSSGIILINDGKGNFPSYWPIYGLDYSFEIYVNDFNRDGFLDAFYYGANGLSIGLGDGKGNFQESSLNWYWYFFTTADFNGDGYPDIAGINVTDGDQNNPITDWGIAFNDGKGNFKDTISIKVPGGGVGSYILPSDLDNDGDVDITIASNSYCCGPNLTRYGLDGIMVGRNNGEGVFDKFDLYSSDEYVGIWFSKTLYSSDFNNDGYNDIAIMGYSGTVLLNYGDGTFHNDSASIKSFWGPEQGGSFTAGDVNGDGRMDIIVSGWKFPPELTITYYTAINFTDTLPISDIFAAALADLDGDGDLDIVHSGYGVLITLNKDTITSVANYQKMPNEFHLYQNYPNPFNPNTTIKFDVNKQTFVSIRIYDCLGKEVKSLMNEVKLSGSYSVEFDGSNVASGIYLYKFTAGNYTSTKKMLLLK